MKVGEEGLCKSTVFLSYISDSPDRLKSSPRDRTFNIDVCGVTAECGSCGIKLGKFSQIDSPCPCGILVPGPALRINSNKVSKVASSFSVLSSSLFSCTVLCCAVGAAVLDRAELTSHIHLVLMMSLNSRVG